jgi:GMP synthase (glutamine-hydrolysing)
MAKFLLLLLGHPLAAQLFYSSLGLAEDESLVVVPVCEDPAALPAPADVAREYAAVVISGSSAMVTDRPEWSLKLAAFLRELVALDQVPILGVCYGHQILADALGGSVRYNVKGRGLGTVAVRLRDEARDDVLFGVFGGAEHIAVHVSHIQHVERLPHRAIRLASSEHDQNHAFRVGRHTYGLQFHPEFNVKTLKMIIKFRKEALALEGRETEEEKLVRMQNTQDGKRILQRFADFARTKWSKL